MAKTYYVIELTPRWLAVVVVAMAGLVVAAFALGYGAAWSVKDGGSMGNHGPGILPTPTISEVDVVRPDATPIVASVATPMPMKPTLTPPPGWKPSVATPSPEVPTATPPPPTATPRPVRVSATAVPTALPTVAEFWVQVLASGRQASITSARAKLEENGFPDDHQKVVRTRVAGGNVLYKLRVGPFPDRVSADRVMERMQRSGFPDAWVVSP